MRHACSKASHSIVLAQQWTAAGVYVFELQEDVAQEHLLIVAARHHY
ncbi:hypothetical protein [Arthrobacter ramosus]|uniref:Uncharacterized protein n=1 Tax=Arthrobacter ramosus TaxID=1672 RepID=A0ABV5XXJ1_ARTRM|nr:hypothetical protein [Arthrobacter ramosus]